MTGGPGPRFTRQHVRPRSDTIYSIPYCTPGPLRIHRCLHRGEAEGVVREPAEATRSGPGLLAFSHPLSPHCYSDRLFLLHTLESWHVDLYGVHCRVECRLVFVLPLTPGTRGENVTARHSNLQVAAAVPFKRPERSTDGSAGLAMTARRSYWG